ncbi:serine/threonine-protein phosphatase 6 regulatory ankyrin repeat subunit B-like [Mytilus edulis]|uniref:serine/threonine-protein phosphatase 6 regulatory ankyrin repeat subunit B-like n=1 Tax=Mytilus edulis TaxID=6550 RepID=UPI0039EE9F81
MFPLSCKLYKDRKIGKSSRFFHNPFKFYKEELDNFYEEVDRMRCCFLFLCVLHSGCLNEAILMENADSDDFSRTLKIIFSNFRLDSKMSPKRILDILDTLLNTYLKKKNGQYYVIHDRLFDFLCYYFGQRYQSLVISYSDSEIIRDRTLLKSLETSLQNFIETTPQEFTILIDKKYENEYIERLIQDMLSGYIDDVLYNHQVGHKDFRDRLLIHLQELDDDDVTVTCVLSEFVLDENERTSQLLPLNFACKYGYRELFNFFLSKTKDVNAYEGNNIPLITACRKGDKYMTGLLLEKGADVNQTDALGCSPLLWSCVDGNLDIIRMLLSKGADIDNMDDNSKSSPLVWVCCGEFLWLRASRDLGGKICSSSHANEFAAFVVENINDQFCTHEHFIETCITILTIGHLKGRMHAKEQLLKDTPQDFESTLSKGMEIIKGEEIENNDDSLTGKNTNNQTQPFIEIMNLFLDRGVDIDKPSKGGLTAFAFACIVGINKDSQSINYLLSKGACVNIHDINGIYPLHFVIGNEREDLVKLLIKNNALINCHGLSPLVSAINTKNVSIVNILITHKADINIRLENGSTLLHYAIQFDNANLINTLLKAGISVNCEDRQGNTPLIDAVRYGLEKICVILIKEGANVNTSNDDKETPLMLAIDEENISIVNILIEQGADINIRSTHGSTLLHYAIQFNNADLINTLLKAGISVNCEDGQGNTPLMIAAHYSLANIADILIKEGAKVDTCNNNGTSLLMIASSNNDVDILEMIKTKKEQYQKYQTIEPLFSACINDNQEVASLLLQTNCDINIPRENGNTCLFEASDKGLESMVSLLIEKGAKVNTSNNAGDTPLTVASTKGHTAIVRLLITAKGDMYQSNKNGESSPILACLHNHLEVVKVFLDNGWNIESVEMKTKQTCLSVASCNGNDKIVAYLVEQGADVNSQSNIGNTPLTLAASKNHLNIVQILIEHKADVNIRNEKGSTSLSLASSKGFDEIVACLIEHEANVNTQSNIGTTPLMLAASKGHFNIVKKLIVSKADVNIQNDKGSTCLSLASSKGFDNIVTYLIDQKASINTANSDGDSPLMLASKNGHISTVKKLLENGAKADIKNKDLARIFLNKKTWRNDNE